MIRNSGKTILQIFAILRRRRRRPKLMRVPISNRMISLKIQTLMNITSFAIRVINSYVVIRLVVLVLLGEIGFVVRVLELSVVVTVVLLVVETMIC